MINIILCGGNGTRLWPISRTLMPKQFIKLFDDHSLFQLTAQRNRRLCQESLVVANTEHYFLAQDQLEEIGIDSGRFLLEPIAKNTAPALALAAFSLEPDTLMLVTPSDHLIHDDEAYDRAVMQAIDWAKEGYLVTFGVVPNAPETGYGYIYAQEGRVRAFVEKPDRPTAERYIASGEYYWNSGIFLFQAHTFLHALQTHAPNIYTAAKEAYEQARQEGFLVRISHEAMAKIPEESIDYAVMEKSSTAAMVQAEFAWSDVGSFDALSKEFPTDAAGNTKNESLIALDAQNNFVYSHERLIALVDVEDLIVVDTADALLIGKKGSGQKIKKIVTQLKTKASDLPHIHVTVHRPWGTYTILESAERYKIKRIDVKPGKRLSLQKHYHRSEHWVVVSGTARVVVGEETKIVRANESVYIPIAQPHRLENPGRLPLVLVEAQVGEYTGEDDIERIEDDYVR